MALAAVLGPKDPTPLDHYESVRNPLGRVARNLGFRLAGRVPLVQRRFAMNLSELAIRAQADPMPGPRARSKSVGT